MSDSIVACLLITNFPVKAERRRYPVLRGEPLVIFEHVGTTDLVLECSPEARGVEAGIPLAEAMSRCPGAFVLPSDRQFYDEVCRHMADRLAMRFPDVERAALGCLFAGLEGMAPAYCGDARLIASLLQIAPPDFGLRVGVASHRLAAYVSAAGSRPGRAVKASPATEASLGSSFIEHLPLSPGEPGPPATGGRPYPGTTGGDARRHGARTLGRRVSPRLGTGSSHEPRTGAGVPASGLIRQR